MKISFIIPVYNEEVIINELYKRLIASIKKDFKKLNYEIIFVNDGSTDNTFRALTSLHRKNRNVKVIDFSRNFGHHIAITAGLDLAKGDYVVLMDGDLQDKPEEIIKLYKKLKEGYDVVYAIRKDKKFNLFKKINSEIFNRIIKFLVHEDIIINSTIFRIMTKQVVENINLLRESNRYILGIVGWAGFKTASQEVIHGTRYAGKTKYNFSKQVDLAMNAVFSFSNYPIKLAIKFGILVIFMSFLLILFALARKLVFGTAFIGWTSILVTILALGGFQIVLLGIIGEYVGRSYIENKKRPLYIIRKKLI